MPAHDERQDCAAIWADSLARLEPGRDADRFRRTRWSSARSGMRPPAGKCSPCRVATAPSGLSRGAGWNTRSPPDQRTARSELPKILRTAAAVAFFPGAREPPTRTADARRSSRRRLEPAGRSPGEQRLRQAREGLGSGSWQPNSFGWKATIGAVIGSLVEPGRQVSRLRRPRTSLVLTWDAATGQKLQTMRGHNDFVEAVRWSPDGSRLASAGIDNSVRIWDPRTGQEAFVAARERRDVSRPLVELRRSPIGGRLQRRPDLDLGCARWLRARSDRPGTR